MMKNNRWRVAAFMLLGAVVFPALIFAAAKAPPAPPSVTAKATRATPNPVASGKLATSTLNATAVAPTGGAGGPTYGAPAWKWTVAGGPGVTIHQPHHGSPAATLKTAITSPGHYTLTETATATWTASNGTAFSASGSVSIPLVVVGVHGLNYYQPGPIPGFVEVPATLHVLAGQSVTF
jgi:hypothetical protein